MYYFFSKNEFDKGVLVVWRFTLLIIIASILTFTSSISQLVYAIEKLFYPLKIFKISPRNIAVMVSTTIRFIPLLFLEANKIKDAQKSRGANPKKIKHIIFLVIPLLRKTFDKANNLADAIESRCYRDYGYSHFKELKIDVRDYFASIFIFLLIIITSILN
jgi:energy-coupling factor transport system permease protein